MDPSEAESVAEMQLLAQSEMKKAEAARTALLARQASGTEFFWHLLAQQRNLTWCYFLFSSALFPS